jgi:hypothetical protein
MVKEAAATVFIHSVHLAKFGNLVRPFHANFKDSPPIFAKLQG